MDAFLPVSSVLISESITSLYPILIKSIDSNILTQVFARMITMTTTSSIMSSENIFKKIKPRHHAISLLQLFHIFVSYVGFKNLNAGTSITIFYIYPLFNVIIDGIIKKQLPDLKIILLILLAILGVFTISIPSMTTNETGKKLFMIGLISMILSALTESITYHFYKEEKHENPFDSILTLYLTGTIILTTALPFFIDKKNLGKLIGLNFLIGIIGFYTRFYGIPRVSVELYSGLAFVGIISAYIFGWLINKEKITTHHIIGTIMILASIKGIHKS